MYNVQQIETSQASPRVSTGRVNRALAVSGFVFVAAWLIGLTMEPSSPSATASASEIVTFYMTHRSTAMLQSYLFDGVAGIALLILASVIRMAHRQLEAKFGALTSAMFATGVAASTVSLVQAAFGEVLSHVVPLHNSVVVQTLFDLVNESDTFKMLALAFFIGATSLLGLLTGSSPSWVGWLGVVLSPALVISGLSFILDNSVLYAALYVILPAMLVWVTAETVALIRTSRR